MQSPADAEETLASAVNAVLHDDSGVKNQQQRVSGAALEKLKKRNVDLICFVWVTALLVAQNILGVLPDNAQNHLTQRNAVAIGALFQTPAQIC